MKYCKQVSLLTTTIASLLVLSCGNDKSADFKTFKNCRDKKDIVADYIVDKNTKLSIGVFIDATISMGGYSAAEGVQNTVMDQFLEDLESSILTGWRNSEISWNKFGTAIKKIDRSEFLKAKEWAFYNEEGIREETNIDSVISNVDSSKVTVVITDLFQSAGDANAIVSQIKDNCFSKGIQVGIAGIPADYHGKIYDARVSPFDYKSIANDPETLRPFYLMVFGQEAKIAHLFDALSTRPYMKNGGMLIISKNPVEQFSVELSSLANQKNKKSKGSGMSVLSRPVVSDNSIPYRYRVSLNVRDTVGVLGFEMKMSTHKYVPKINIPSLLLEVYRQDVPTAKAKQCDSLLSNDIQLQSISEVDGIVKGDLSVMVSNPVRTQSYAGYMMLNPLDGVILPDWVAKFNSENPTSESEPNKTINLNRFVGDLCKMNATVNAVAVNKFYLDIRYTKK